MKVDENGMCTLSEEDCSYHSCNTKQVKMCKCYHAERNFLGKIGVCWGTKECEACSCGGDESKCDFYDYVRERASLSHKQTNADRIRAMNDEGLASFMSVYADCRCPESANYCGVAGCVGCWLDWLKQEATA